MFKLSTRDIQSFITSELRKLADGSAKRGDKDSKPLKITINGARYGEFVPIIIGMEPKVLKHNKTDGRPEVFTAKDEDNVPLKEEYGRTILRYAFSKEYKQLIYSSRFKAVNHIGEKDIMELRRYLDPVIIYKDKEKRIPLYVAVFLDPVKVFHQMLIDENYPDEKFKTNIIDVKKGKDAGEFTYTIERELVKSNDFSITLRGIERAINPNK